MIVVLLRGNNNGLDDKGWICVSWLDLGDSVWKRGGGGLSVVEEKRWHDDLKGGSQQADPSSEARPKICDGGAPGECLLGSWCLGTE